MLNSLFYGWFRVHHFKQSPCRFARGVPHLCGERQRIDRLKRGKRHQRERSEHHSWGGSRRHAGNRQYQNKPDPQISQKRPQRRIKTVYLRQLILRLPITPASSCDLLEALSATSKGEQVCNPLNSVDQLSLDICPLENMLLPGKAAKKLS